MISNIIKRMKNKKSLLILPVFFIIFIFSTFCLSYSILKINNIENIIRFAFVVFLILLFLYLFIVKLNLLLKGKDLGIILFSILLVFIFSTQLFLCSFINKIYNSIDNISRKTTTFSTSLISLSDFQSNDISDLKNLKIGLINDKKSIDGYQISQEIIKKYKLDDNNEFLEFDSFITLLDELYKKNLDMIFISSNYATMFSSLSKINENEEKIYIYENIVEETKVIYSKSKEVARKSAKNNKIDKPFTMLIMGVDSVSENIHTSNAFNGDALLLLTFNPKTFNVTMLSIPRDTYVPIMCFKDKRENKITHAAWYGENCMIETIENFVDIDIDYYLKINFKGVVKLVDALGGIEVDVPYSFCEQDSNRRWNENTVYVEKGTQRLNGEEVLALARNRKPNTRKCSKEYTNYSSNDFIRGLNQQKIIKGLTNEFKNIKSLNEIYNILEVIEKSMDTSFSTNQILSFYDIAKEMIFYSTLRNTEFISFEQLYLSGYDKYIYDPVMKLNLYNFIYYEQSLKEIKNAMEINLELKEPTLIKEFEFSINENYEKKLTGKGAFNIEKRIETFPNFIGKSKAYVTNWANIKNIKVTYKTEKVRDKLKNNLVLKQSIPVGFVISNIKNGIIITLGEYYEEQKIDTEIKDEIKEVKVIPDFSSYTIDLINSWGNSNKISVIINYIETEDSNLFGKFANQSVDPNTNLENIESINIGFYKEKTQD